MSPFASLLHEIRMKHRISQSELADIIGYEQTYISALEVGKKGPPTPEFIDRLILALEMSPAESQQLRDAADASQRKLVISPDMPQDVYLMIRSLRKWLPDISGDQIKLITDILELTDKLKDRPKVVPLKLKRRNFENKGEAHM